jgi:type II secretory pathway pseudopilin PulG
VPYSGLKALGQKLKFWRNWAIIREKAFNSRSGLVVASPQNFLAELRLYWVCTLPLLCKPTPFVQRLALKWLGWLPKQCHTRSALGFTLAEVLISLLILAEIATFTIPKILISQQNVQKMAVFKEDIATIQAGIYNSAQNGEFTLFNHACYSGAVTGFYDLLAGFLNYTKTTRTNSQTGKFYLANGSTISPVPGYTWGFNIDWNGDNGPNLYGDDLFTFQYNDCNGTQYGIPSNRYGVVNYDTSGLVLYNSIFP